MLLVAIDPGNVYSAYVVMQSADCKPLYFGKVENAVLEEMLKTDERFSADEYVIERVACYGMAVGREVFDTCEWIGRFSQIIKDVHGVVVQYVFRTEEKKFICHNMSAGDANIRRALIDRFAEHDMKNGKGTKKQPDFFYGFAKNVWAAFAVGYTHRCKKEIAQHEIEIFK